MVQCQDEETLCEPESARRMGTLSSFSHHCAIKGLYVLNKQKKKSVFIDVLDCPLVLTAKGQTGHFYLFLMSSCPPWFLTHGYPWNRNLIQCILLKWITSGWNLESKQCQQSSQWLDTPLILEPLLLTLFLPHWLLILPTSLSVMLCSLCLECSPSSSLPRHPRGSLFSLL